MQLNSKLLQDAKKTLPALTLSTHGDKILFHIAPPFPIARLRYNVACAQGNNYLLQFRSRPKCCHYFSPMKVFHVSISCFIETDMGRKTIQVRRKDDFTWPSSLRHFLKCLPNMSSWQQPLLHALDLFSVGWVIQCPSQGAAAQILPKTYAPWPSIFQLNTEGLIENKISVIEQLAYTNKAFIIVIQENHCITVDKLVISCFSLTGSILSRTSGLATFVHERMEWSLVDQYPEQSETEWLHVDVAGYKIINVYKPPRSRLTPTAIPTFPHPSLYVGDFNCQHVNWGYNTTFPDGESLDIWPTSNNIGMLYKPKETASFFSRRWNVGTNPDLALESLGLESRLPDSGVLGTFLLSQHRPSLITPPRFKVPANSDPVKRWNFRKADWKRFCLLTGECVERLPPPDTPNIEKAYQIYAWACYLRLNNASHVSAGRTMCHAGPDQWNIPTPEGHSISEPFRPEYLSAALRRLKPGKSLGSDSIFPEFILYAGSALKSWFWDFLASCMRQFQIPKYSRRVPIVAVPKLGKPLGSQELSSNISAVSSLKSPRDLSTLVSNQSSTHCSHRSRWAFDTGGRSPGHPVDTGHRG